METVQIRKARPEDAAEIANVHISSWREAYKGLLEDDFLNARPLHFKGRYELWKKCIAQNEIIYAAESKEHGIVGFANAGKSRDKLLPNNGEIFCIYLLSAYHKKKIGFKLLISCFESLYAQGFTGAHLWVLENNPTIAFYEKANAKKLEAIKEETIGHLKVREFCYYWDNINFAPGTTHVYSDLHQS